MTDLRALVEQMRALCEKATPGPWEAQGVMVTGNGLDVCLTDFFDAGPDEPFAKEDAAFIAACREAVPQLLDALAGAEKEKTAAEAGRILTQESMQRWIDFHNDRADKAEARLSKLQELGRQVVEWGKRSHPVDGDYTPLDAFTAELRSDR